MFQALDWLPLVERYRVATHRLDPRVLDLSAEQLDRTFSGADAEAVGAWSVRTVLGHLADAELVCTHRIRRIAAEDGVVLADWDHESFLTGGLYGPIEARADDTSPAQAQHRARGSSPAAFLGAIHALRLWTAQWLAGLPEAARERSALHPAEGERTLQGWVARFAWHFEHHAWFANAKVTTMLGAPDDAPAAPAAGCGPGCGCAPAER
jgi:hypothetical protein